MTYDTSNGVTRVDLGPMNAGQRPIPFRNGGRPAQVNERGEEVKSQDGGQ